MSAKPRVLFLSHSASRNGATILLLHLLRWLKEHGDFDFDVVVNGRGELLDEFRELCPTSVWRDPSVLLGSLPRPWQSSLKPRLQAQMLKAVLRGRRYDVVHVNTVAMWPHVPVLATRCQGLLWHVHELGYAVRASMRGEAWRQTFPLAKRFVAVSHAVKNMLVGDFQVAADKVDLVNGFIPPINLSSEEKQLKREKLRKELGWSDKTFVVGGCGTLGWRKGTDLFLQVARNVREKCGDTISFLWVGGGTKDEAALEFEHDIRSLGLEGNCKWIPNTPNARDYYLAMDAFALTSREDPFPLVMLEAGAAGLPVVCFADSGGGPEFIGKDAGLSAPYLDVASFSARLITLRDNCDLRMKLGAEAMRRVEIFHTVEKQAPLLANSIEKCLRNH